MAIVSCGDEVKITGIPDDFDIAKIFGCGQCFRWDADESGVYTGVAYGRAAALRQDSGAIYITASMADFDTLWRGYFDLDRDYRQIRESLCVTDFMRRAVDFGKGIRILRQEPWEALCSFIISQNNHIPRIKKIIDTLCREFGGKIMFGGRVLYTFPDPGRLAQLSDTDMAVLRAGYRVQYIIGAAQAVSSGSLDLEALRSASPAAARAELKKLRGVGDKVADCVLLYGLHMPGSFPVDVWMKRALRQHFPPGFDPSCFSPHAGIAQQYIFYYTWRNTKSRPGGEAPAGVKTTVSNIQKE